MDTNETGYDELARLDDDDAQVADGEIIEADSFEVAEADRETDLIRASKYAALLDDPAAAGRR